MNRRRSVQRAQGVIVAFVAAFLVAASSRDAHAQLKGHYIPGFAGMDSGSQPPPSITFAVPFYLYPTDTIKDDHGEDIGGNPRITASFTGVSVIVVTNAKVFGANYGFQAVPADAMKSRLESNALNVSRRFAFSDITVAPVWLGWHRPQADFVAGWSVFFPTGKWELGGDENAGLGMFSNDFQAGTTLHFDKAHSWAASLLGTYEIHSHKNDTDVKVGDILTLEGGAGKTFYTKVSGTPLPRITKIGLAYYGQFKVSSDTGSGPLVDALLAGRKDRVFGIGGEVSVFLPTPKLLLGARVIPEFGARNRTQGLTMLFTVGYQAKLLVKAP